MRKVVALFILILTLVLSGCNNNETSSKRENDIATRYDKLLFLPDTPSEFVEYLYSNPIDFTMKNEEESSGIYSTKDINEFYSKYYDIWYDEMNTVYANLRNQLTDEAKEILEESQKAWEEENQRDSELWWYVFDKSKGHGSGDTSMIVIQSINIDVCCQGIDMSILNQIVFVVLCYLLAFFFIRWFWYNKSVIENTEKGIDNCTYFYYTIREVIGLARWF